MAEVRVTRGPGPDPYVSTGQLPAVDRVRGDVDEALARYAPIRDGAPSSVYPALARVDPRLFGLCVMGTDGSSYAAGDADAPFTLMSIAKPFVFALACDGLGVDVATARLGANATGRPFDSLAAVEEAPDGRTNPMVNPGAIATTAALLDGPVEDSWDRIREGLGRFAGRELLVDLEVHASASATNHRNQAIARLLQSAGAIHVEAADAVEVYTRQSCLAVTARDLAVMGATLADGGVNPVTGARVVSADACACTLAVMATAGLYETSGDWLVSVGLPGKSGISGGLVTAAPGKGGLGTFSPPLDRAGNSVRGQLAARFLSHSLGLTLFASNARY